MLENLSYDLVSVLDNKCEAIAAYEKYLQDAQQKGDQRCIELFRSLRQREEEDVERVRREIERQVQEGAFH